MKLFPSKTKFAKFFKGRIQDSPKRGSRISFGKYALKSLEPARIKGKQIESARKVISRHLKRTGKLWIRAIPNIPVTKKPVDVRMGKGKGPVDFYVSRINPGRIIFELDCVSELQAKEALLKAKGKLPIKTIFVKDFS